VLIDENKLSKHIIFFIGLFIKCLHHTLQAGYHYINKLYCY